MVLTLLLHFETILKFVLFIISYQKTDVQEMTLSPILNVQDFKAVICKTLCRVRVKRGNGKAETEKRKSGKKGKRRKKG